MDNLQINFRKDDTGKWIREPASNDYSDTMEGVTFSNQANVACELVFTDRRTFGCAVVVIRPNASLTLPFMDREHPTNCAIGDYYANRISPYPPEIPPGK